MKIFKHISRYFISSTFILMSCNSCNVYRDTVPFFLGRTTLCCFWSWYLLREERDWVQGAWELQHFLCKLILIEWNLRSLSTFILGNKVVNCLLSTSRLYKVHALPILYVYVKFYLIYFNIYQNKLGTLKVRGRSIPAEATCSWGRGSALSPSPQEDQTAFLNVPVRLKNPLVLCEGHKQVNIRTWNYNPRET